MLKVLAKGEQIPHSAELVKLELAEIEEMTGVSQDAIVAAARLLAQHNPAVIIYGSGVTHNHTASNVIKAVRSLAFVAGNVAIVGLPGECNFVGAYDMGIDPALLPGYLPVSDSEARAIFDKEWNTSLNATPGRTYERILSGVREGEIKALYLAGEVPPLKELANLAFLVVQDIASTENLQYAHVVLPATSSVEMEGSLTNLEGRVQRLHQAIPPVGLSRPGWMIVQDIAERMGADHWNYSSAADVMAEIACLVPAYQGMSFGTLDNGGALRRFKPDAPVEFSPFKVDTMPKLVSDEFPFTLITERNLFYYHGICLTKQIKGMNLIKNEEVLQLSTSDLTRLGIADGSRVTVASPHGSAEYPVQAKSGIAKGTAFISINRVVGSPLFPMLAPTTKAYAVRITGQSRQPEV
jgi:predicted molibdopterin-dependent oxidoreductase YjgC